MFNIWLAVLLSLLSLFTGFHIICIVFNFLRICFLNECIFLCRPQKFVCKKQILVSILSPIRVLEIHVNHQETESSN